MPSGSTDSLYSTEKIQLAAVTPMQTMYITLSVDEMDISLLHLGMTAEVTFEALPGQKFSAQITELSQFGETGDGSSKFQVKLELPCQGNMLPGMNAKVKIPLETRSDCLTVPSPVETGLSDGEYVQILSGLSEGQTIWYRYYDQLVISNAVK